MSQPLGLPSRNPRGRRHSRLDEWPRVRKALYPRVVESVECIPSRACITSYYAIEGIAGIEPSLRLDWNPGRETVPHCIS